MRSTLLRKRTALIVLAAAIALSTAACVPPPAPAGGGEPGDPYVARVFRALNQDRARAGLPALSQNPQLEGLAGSWSSQMSRQNSLYHQDLGSILNSPGYANFRTLGENIIVAPGSYSAEQLEAAWMASPPHKANIMNGSFNTVGIGVFRGPDGRIWATQDFGG